MSQPHASQQPVRADELSVAIQVLLDCSEVSADERVQILAGALVLEASRPYWASGRSAADAHAMLRRNDSEVADVVESIAPMLVNRAQAQQDARAALDAVAALLHGQAT
jgi:hypothetical protein